VLVAVCKTADWLYSLAMQKVMVIDVGEQDRYLVLACFNAMENKGEF
jgi:hypothetical protein